MTSAKGNKLGLSRHLRLVISSVLYEVPFGAYWFPLVAHSISSSIWTCSAGSLVRPYLTLLGITSFILTEGMVLTPGNATCKCRGWGRGWKREPWGGHIEITIDLPPEEVLGLR